MKMKEILKKEKYLLLFHIILIVLVAVVFKLNLEQKIIEYIMFNTDSIHFEDFLNVLLTLFIALFGLVVTICSVLIALGDNPFIKAIKEFNQSKHFMRKIKISLVTSIFIIIFISVIYCGFDFSNIVVRFILIYLILLSTTIFFKHFKSLIRMILRILEREIN